MTRILAWTLIACFACGGAPAALSPVPSALAAEEWKADFDDICAKTQDAMALTPEELTALIGRCDRLRPKIEKLDDSTSKVYLKRLQMCRDLYAFVLGSKSAKPLP